MMASSCMFQHYVLTRIDRTLAHTILYPWDYRTRPFGRDMPGRTIVQAWRVGRTARRTASDKLDTVDCIARTFVSWSQ